MAEPVEPPIQLVVPAELTGPLWRRAAAALAAKLLAELLFEEELRAEPAGEGRWRVDVGDAAYRFTGRRAALDTWRIDPASVVREDAPEDAREDVPEDEAAPEAADPLRLLLDLHAARGLEPAVTALTATELTATLAADAHLLRTGRPVAELADLPHLELEGHQTGHPWLVANKGRVGFSARDRAAYAPEARRRLRLPWIAVHDDLATYAAVPGLGRDVLLARELDTATRERFAAVLAGQGLDPARYVPMPVHPWQWDEVVVPVFARELAERAVVPLGEAPDEYLPQQSIRTFGNVSRPGGLDVKVSLAILNTMVYRGIPSELVAAAPPGTRWLHALRDADPFLAAEHRLLLPGEIAAACVRHPVLEAVPGVPYRYAQLLGVIWREPLAALLEPGERARTFAALLHVDPDGEPFAGELVRRSGLGAEAWLDRLLGVVLPPLLHLLVRYGVAVNPHGENASVVYADDVPVRLAVKDFVDDLKLLDLRHLAARDPERARRLAVPEHDALPPEVRGVLLHAGPEDLTGSLTKSLLLAHLRYLAPLCEERLGVPEVRFWALARAHVAAYRARFPELAERFALLDVTAPTLQRVCLNRERLLPGGYHDRAERDAHFDVAASGVPNPLWPGA
jgi:siderophore synthetase component